MQARGRDTQVDLEECCVERSGGVGVLVHNQATVKLLQGSDVKHNGQASQTVPVVPGEAPGKLIVHPRAKISSDSLKGHCR